MLSNGSAAGILRGDDVMLTTKRPINLVSTFEKLEYDVCEDDCSGGSQRCHESLDSWGGAVGACSKFLPCCEFKVKNGKDNDELVFGSRGRGIRSKFPGSLKDELVDVQPNGYLDSCDPNINDVDKMIRLPSWPITVKNAKMHVSEVAPSTPKLNDSSSMASFPWLAIFITVFVIIFAVFGIGFVVFYLFKKRQSSKLVSPPSDITESPTVSDTNVATLETPSEMKLDLNFTKSDPLQNSEKCQKKKLEKKIKVKTKTIQKLKINENDPNPTIILSPTIMKTKKCDPTIERVIPRSLKSVKTDSLDETTKKDNMCQGLSL
uniref:Uncharacterized protein n=1 Tax=Panagrolaimus superbus TaxID=310955 RepID=A0A914Z4B5_9BILA